MLKASVIAVVVLAASTAGVVLLSATVGAAEPPAQGPRPAAPAASTAVPRVSPYASFARQHALEAASAAPISPGQHHHPHRTSGRM